MGKEAASSPSAKSEGTQLCAAGWKNKLERPLGRGSPVLCLVFHFHAHLGADRSLVDVVVVPRWPQKPQKSPRDLAPRVALGPPGVGAGDSQVPGLEVKQRELKSGLAVNQSRYHASPERPLCI